MTMLFHIGNRGQVSLWLNKVKVQVGYTRYIWKERKNNDLGIGSLYVTGTYQTPDGKELECKVNYNFSTDDGVCKLSDGSVIRVFRDKNQ